MFENPIVIRVGKVESSNGYTTEQPYAVPSTDSQGRTHYNNISYATRNNHDTWLRDVASGQEFQYRSSGTINARPGHILGILWYKGRALLDYNLNLSDLQAVKRTQNGMWHALVITLMHLVLGFLTLPFSLLFSFLRIIGLGKFMVDQDRGLYTNGPRLRFTDLYEFICAIISSLLYIGMWWAFAVHDLKESFITFFFVHLVFFRIYLLLVRRSEDRLYSDAMKKMKYIYERTHTASTTTIVS